ncbi:hypothetical protein [Lysinibacillus piscis]|uniref:Uncharacterized protein n=1 Tax=Lysinibacillus piscis TaxID=2518931 RepID=A0ABQ5NQ10_9BACI|nr:hypothetical protein [Lysinibacillus sp. KH24]GLC90407.1 hypothetical protein LYSBPC_35340 [Lysinibacillus sp. KH24]
MILALWYLSFTISIASFGIGIYKLSWRFMLLSAFTFAPVAYYFGGAENAWKYIGLTPFLLLIIAVGFWFVRAN